MYQVEQRTVEGEKMINLLIYRFFGVLYQSINQNSNVFNRAIPVNE